MTPDSGKLDEAVQPGVQVGSYRVEAPLGKGGMGVVYLATDTRLDRRVAIKFLSKSLLDADARRRFQHEARMASALNHPHILSVYDVGDYAGLQYLVTEFIDGGTLEGWARSEPRAWPQIVDLLIGVAEALAAAHAASIVHRDVKPGNILVSRAGYAKLADFGLAKPTDDARRGDSRAYTQPGALIGTAAYMSPEQIAGRALDSRSDIFSFGVVLYELLARRRPFVADTDLDIMYAIMHAPAQTLPSDVPEALRLIVDKTLEKEPAARYQSMRELVVDLRRVVRREFAPAADAASSIRPSPGAREIPPLARRSNHRRARGRLGCRLSLVET